MGFMESASRARLFAIIALSALLTACAAPKQSLISLPDGYHTQPRGAIGIVMSEIPKPDTAFPGADCLLCLATASMVNRSLTDAVRQWPTDDLKALSEEAAAILRAKGHAVVLVKEPLKIADLPDRAVADGFARKDFAGVGKRAAVDRLLVIDVRFVGAERNYSAYIATGPAVAKLQAEAYIVDLGTHKLEWYEPITAGRTAQGTWDEPPKFPGLTNAYFTAVEETKDFVKRPLSR